MKGLVRIKLPQREIPKVVGDPTREPVNRQAALITRRATWLEQPLPPEQPPLGEFERLKTENEKQKRQIMALHQELKASHRKLKAARKRFEEAAEMASEKGKVAITSADTPEEKAFAERELRRLELLVRFHRSQED